MGRQQSGISKHWNNILTFEPQNTRNTQKAQSNIDELVSTNTDQIKKINIFTYQSITQTDTIIDNFYADVLEDWYDNIKDEFDTFVDTGHEDKLKKLVEQHLKKHG